MQFEWDAVKAEANLSKHGVRFHEAATAFGDPLAVTFPDLDHSVEEQRFLTFGYDRLNRLLVIAHCDREDRIRVISARRATPKERRQFEAGTW